MPTPTRLADLGEDRRGQRRGDAADHGVGQRRRRVDAEHAERLEVDEHLAAVGVDAELGQRDARRADGAGGVGEQLDRRRAGQHHVRPAPSHGGGSAASPVERQLDGAVGADPHDGDPRRRVDERGGGGADGDVDAQQALAGVDRAQPALGGDRPGGGSGTRARGRDAAQAAPAPRREQGQHAGGEQGGLADADR